MTTPTVLITGANRGIGLEFTRQYANDGWQVLACCRAPQQANALNTLAAQHGNIKVLALDVADFNHITSLADTLSHQPIDVLINNAGVYPDSAFGETDAEAWALAFKVNSMSPLKMAEAFTANVRAANLRKSSP